MSQSVIVHCPSCSASYDVPDRLLAAGPRLMQCSKCGHRFHAAPLPPAAAAIVEEAPARAEVATAPMPVREEQTHAPPILPVAVATPAPAVDRLAVCGWIGTFGLLVAGGTFVIMNQAEIEAAWPPASRFFGWLGLVF